MRRHALAVALLCATLYLLAQALEPPDARKQVISAGEASQDAKLATSRIKLAPGLKAELHAAEPLLANPVAFCFDLQGNIYVAETYRLHEGVTDNRGHMYWLNDELALTTVEERDAKYRKHLKDRYASFEKEREQIRKLVDSKGTGKPDTSHVFSDNYRRAVDGLGAGVLVHQGNIYFTCIPDLWLLQDTKNAHRADVQQSLSTGYGVHTSFIGHDLHGLVVSPVDGKIYFSIGDRGANIQTQEGKKIEVPHTGAVFRCYPDGSELELVAQGLRNPQELAFDDDGNLFTGDNNSDSGDKARFMYLPFGADGGWHIGWQYLERPYSRGPWNSEHLWYPPRKDQPAYIVPALINIGDGPSGLVYYPGTGLPQRYQGHFFLCDFRGTPSNSGIRSFRTEPHGAGFSVINSEQFAWGVLATDVDFGPDGGLYILDWVEGWGKTGKGRIHRLFDPAHQNSSLARDIQTLLASDWKSKTVAELVPLLGHVDRRIRMEAQTTLVHHREQATAVASILQFLADSPNETAQVFACWTLGQMLRRTPSVEAADRLRKLVLGNQTRLVIAILKSLSDSKPAFTLKGEEYAALLQHQNSAVKAQAALCMAAHPTEGLFVPICELLQQATEDPWLRHAGIMALASLLQKDPSYWEKIRGLAPAVRLAGVVAARKLKLEAALVSYLGDKDRTIQMESIRALHDEPGYPEGKRAIALLDINREYSEPIQLRLLHAQYLSGTAEAAGKLAAFVSEGNRSVTLRGEALKMLGNWAKPSGRDWVIGLWRPIAPRSADPAKKAVLSAFADWKTLPAPILTEAIRAVEKLQLAVLGSSVLELARNASSSLEVRLAAMQAATSLGGEGVEEVARGWLSSSEPKERLAARTTLVKLRPDKAVGLLQQILEQGSVQEQQTALILLRQLENAEADVVLERLLRSFAAGLLAPELQVELQEAVQVRGHTHWKKLWQEGIGQLGKAGPYAQHRPALLGGDASEGRKIFFEKIAVACLRCHKVGNDGGEVGPELTHIGKEKNREYLLESIVDPNKTIAKGFEMTILLTEDGVVHQGVVKKEDEGTVTIITPEAKTVVLKKSDIEERKTGKSAMPEDILQQLSIRELRDLLEYLSSLK